MATIATAQAGDWHTASTWTGGAVPTDGDTAVLNHAVTVSASVTVGGLTVGAGGSLSVADTYTYTATPISFSADTVSMTRAVNDNRSVRLDGAVIRLTPGIYCTGSGDGFAPTIDIVQNTARDIIVDDPGYFGFVAGLQDQKPEGCGRAYAIKRNNNVRYHTLTIHIRATMLGYLGNLYRMAELPFQVLAVADSCIIKGFIETVQPVGEVGKEYITVKVTVAEGE